MSDPGDDPDGEGDADPVGWLDGIEWSEEPPSGGGGTDTSGVDDAGPEPGAEADVTGRTDGDGADPPAASTDRVRAALSEVRREVRKAALVHAAAEGALAAVVATLLLSLFAPAPLSGTLPLPAVVFEALRSLPVVGAVAPRTVGVAPLAALGVGAAGFAGAYRLRLRRPLIERFEAANPPLGEALRTARDAVEGGSDTEMARRLYADVIATLREASTLELVDARRLTLTVVVVAVVAVASVQVAVVNPDLGAILPGGNGPGATVEQPDDDDLQDGEEVLGDAEDVEAGDEVENITVPGTGEGDGDGSTAPDAGTGTGGGGGSGEFDGQQAGFAGDERIEDAELVREYNLRIREFDDGDDDTA